MIKILVALLLSAGVAQAIEQENTVGVQVGNSGQKVKSRATDEGSNVNADGSARYEEIVTGAGQGNVFTLNAKTVTVAATCDIAPLPAQGCPLIGVHNPLGNNKIFVLLKAGCSTVSGTPGGPLYIDVIPANDGISITTSAVIINNLTNRAGGTNAVGFSGGLVASAGMTGSVLATTLRPLGGQAAIAAGAGNYDKNEDLDGSVVIQPGAFAGISAHAVGTTHILSCFMQWKEKIIR